MPKQILVLVPMTEVYRQQIEHAAPGENLMFVDFDKVTPNQVQSADIILGCCPSSYLKGARHLEFLQLSSAGAEGYLVPGVLPEGVTLCNATGAYGLAIGEYMVGVTLELCKHLHDYRDQQLQGVWNDLGEVRAIHGSTVLVVGVGDIGGEYARMMKCLGATTVGVRRADTRCPAYLDELHLTVELETLLPRADIVALALPGTAQTCGLMNRYRLELCKPGALLLNVGRGTAVDTEALCDMLESGHLGGAALDVTEPEPLPPDHRLWRIPNAIITPHISGGYHVEETWRRIVDLCCVNLRAYLSGGPLRNLVDHATGYRKLEQ